MLVGQGEDVFFDASAGAVASQGAALPPTMASRQPMLLSPLPAAVEIEQALLGEQGNRGATAALLRQL